MQELLEQVRKDIEARAAANEALHGQTLAAINNNLAVATGRVNAELDAARQEQDTAKIQESQARLAQLADNQAKQQAFEEGRYKAELAKLDAERGALAQTEKQLASEREKLEQAQAFERGKLEQAQAVEKATLEQEQAARKEWLEKAHAEELADHAKAGQAEQHPTPAATDLEQKEGRRDVVETALDWAPIAYEVLDAAGKVFPSLPNVPDAQDMGDPGEAMAEQVKFAYLAAKVHVEAALPMSREAIDKLAREEQDRTKNSPENTVAREIQTETLQRQAAAAEATLAQQQQTQQTALEQRQEEERRQLEEQQRKALEERLKQYERDPLAR